MPGAKISIPTTNCTRNCTSQISGNESHIWYYVSREQADMPQPEQGEIWHLKPSYMEPTSDTESEALDTEHREKGGSSKERTVHKWTSRTG